eukprot:TRINITY_DN5975_c0_g2_i1.p1 TRINITY_DN5975_c0_g2~~TRINITY_DN5975_c0_g2_i1.p1  ORF type:complete len:356 (+),score=98.55 TRINITY_DN5975_c0_g2_i1:55-1122(+)
MELTKSDWGEYEGQKVALFTISHKSSGFQVTITDMGASIVRVLVPDRDGKSADITITQDKPELLPQGGGYLGASVGRVANRINRGKYSLDGKDYQLYINNTPHSLHGGQVGFDRKIWKTVSHSCDGHAVVIKFSYTSPDGEENYPGTLHVDLTYFIEANKISWEFEAKVDDKTTIINLTNHSYWNLDGLEADLIDEQAVEIKADTFCPVDDNCFPTGDVKSVDNLVDLRSMREFKDVFNTFGGVDNNFFLSEAGKDYVKNQRSVHACASAYSKKTGRLMTVRTSEPCVQLYTGNGLRYVKTSNGGDHKCIDHGAFCLETQRPPDSVNDPRFRDLVTLNPGETYYHRTEHVFSIKQ